MFKVLEAPSCLSRKSESAPNLPFSDLALCTALLGKSLKGGLAAVGGLNLGGGIDPVYNTAGLA
jgi:ATP-dependent Lon protease